MQRNYFLRCTLPPRSFFNISTRKFKSPKFFRAQKSLKMPRLAAFVLFMVIEAENLTLKTMLQLIICSAKFSVSLKLLMGPILSPSFLPFLQHPVLSSTILSYPPPFCPILHHPVLSSNILSHPPPSYHILHHPILSSTILSHPPPFLSSTIRVS